ncbi:uncharacterized protein N7473_009702 [Penicillium subrubescens]|uniref:uncharacterized protein n=1 Tax=Penicillium subrubescens TaxID=1316194 RepID=UPI0025453D69|nr:uncharacterized protein N7473_009702 [Penicillium subrubescens]KAJ5887028.1 hypothetical protein N7473_009702 [Penicillium subrubescens]
MQWLKSLIYLLLFAASAPAQSTEGLYSLVKRRLPNHIDHIHFTIDKSNLQAPRCAKWLNPGQGQFHIGTVIWVSTSRSFFVVPRLHRYLADVAHVDIYWFIGSRLDQAPSKLPHLTKPLHGSSTVPWRYHFNTGTPRPNRPHSPQINNITFQ